MYMLLWAPCVFFAEECANSAAASSSSSSSSSGVDGAIEVAVGPTICEDQSHLVGSAPYFYLALYSLYYCSMGTVLIPLEALGAGEQQKQRSP